MYIFGGENESVPLNDVLVYDIDEARWTQPDIAGERPRPRYAHSASLYRSSLIIFGGSTNASTLNDVHLLDTDTLTFQELSCKGRPPPGRCGHGAACVAQYLVVFGGLATSFLQDLWLLNLETATWTEVSQSSGVCLEGPLPMARSHCSATAMDDCVVFFGGWNGSTRDPHLLHDLHLLWLHQAADAGSPLVAGTPALRLKWIVPFSEGRPPGPRNTHSAAVVGTQLYIYGGWDRHTCFSDLHRCDLGGVLDYLRVQKMLCSFDESADPSEALQSLPRLQRHVTQQAALLDQPLFSDVAFEIDGRRIHAHRCVLATHSEYFRSIFTSGMQEASTPVIEVGCICGDASPSFDAFHALLHYLYCGQPAAQLPYLCELACLADYYGETELQQWVQTHFRKRLTNDSVVDLLEQAHRFERPYLLEDCLAYMAEHRGHFRTPGALEGLPSALQAAVVSRISAAAIEPD